MKNENTEFNKDRLIKEKIRDYMDNFFDNIPQWFLDKVKSETNSEIENDQLKEIITDSLLIYQSEYENDKGSKFNLEDENFNLTKITYENIGLLEEIEKVAYKDGYYPSKSIRRGEYFVLPFDELYTIDINDKQNYDKFVNTFGFTYLTVQDQFSYEFDACWLIAIEDIKKLGFGSSIELVTQLQPVATEMEYTFKINYDIPEGLYSLRVMDDINGVYAEIYESNDIEDPIYIINDSQTLFSLHDGEYITIYSGMLSYVDKLIEDEITKKHLS